MTVLVERAVSDYIARRNGQEHKENGVEFCLYCEPYNKVIALEQVKIIDGRQERVCSHHQEMMDVLGLAANGTYLAAGQYGLADYMRNHIQQVTKRQYANLNV